MEVCPMTMFPTISVADVEESVGWYSAILGLRTVFVLPGSGAGPVLAHLRRRMYADFLLVPDEGGSDCERVKGAGGVAFVPCGAPERGRDGGAASGERGWVRGGSG